VNAMRSCARFFIFLALCLPLAVPAFQGVYVSGIDSICGDVAKEDALLAAIRAKGFDAITLYDLYKLDDAQGPLSDSTTKGARCLSAFLHRARTTGGMKEVSGVHEAWEGFTQSLEPFNRHQADSLSRFTGFNLEFEYWVPSAYLAGGSYCTDYLKPAGLPCDSVGVWTWEVRLLDTLQASARRSGVKAEVYATLFDSAKAAVLAAHADRILLSDYIANADGNKGYAEASSRLKTLAGAGARSEIVMLWSAEAAFLGPWLSGTGAFAGAPRALGKAQANFDSTLAVKGASLAGSLPFGGQQWFQWSDVRTYAVATGTGPKWRHATTIHAILHNAEGQILSVPKAFAPNFSTAGAGISTTR